MSKRAWKWIRFEGAISHLCCAGLVKDICADLKERGCATAEVKECREFSMDMPGMVSVDRPWEDFSFFGLKLSVPSEDLASFVNHLDALKERETNGKKYYKQHALHRCLVLTPSQRVHLLSMFRKRLPLAEQRARVFYADKKSHAQVLREANAKALKIPLENVPDLGGHKIDRFLPKERGES